MRFLIDADLPRRLAHVLTAFGHDAVDVRDIGLSAASDPEVAAFACANKLCLLTADFGFADVRNYPPDQYHGIVVVELPPQHNRKTILDLIDSFLRNSAVIEQLNGKLAIVQWGRVRLRPA